MTQLPEITLLGMDRAELASLVDSLGEPAYRASQLLEAVYRQRVDSIEKSQPSRSHCARSWPKAEYLWACPGSKAGLYRWTERCAT